MLREWRAPNFFRLRKYLPQALFNKCHRPSRERNSWVAFQALPPFFRAPREKLQLDTFPHHFYSRGTENNSIMYREIFTFRGECDVWRANIPCVTADLLNFLRYHSRVRKTVQGSILSRRTKEARMHCCSEPATVQLGIVQDQPRKWNEFGDFPEPEKPLSKWESSFAPDGHIRFRSDSHVHSWSLWRCEMGAFYPFSVITDNKTTLICMCYGSCELCHCVGLLSCVNKFRPRRQRRRSSII